MMAKPTKLVRDDAYEEMGAAYQCILLDRLDGVLKEHGVDDPTAREEIGRGFLAAMGNFHDQGWFKAEADGARLYPLLGFSTEFLNTDTAPDAIGDVYVPSESFSFHEYAFGCADAYFSGDPAGRIETGGFAMDDDDEED
ncbi:MAG: hypothetical protein BGO49_28995 [Planctomycetales bacterium 71-10]|nr:MAG: hypothetical protein BGO49_28995 [Planctomycetales bacterium 71-10]